MNNKMVRYILGKIFLVEAGLMALAALCALLYREECVFAFLITMAILVAAGLPLSFKKPENSVIYAREGFLTVALAWIGMSLFGTLPFVISGAIPNFFDALFETVSGFTTTGATVLSEIESLEHGILFWRSFTHWVGGMGVLVFVLAVLPLSDERSMHLMRAEVPGYTVGKLAPKVRSTAKILYAIYIALTAVEFVLLLFGGMPVFDAVTTAMSTAGTGGFSVRNASMAAYHSAYLETVVAVFMLIFGVDFTVYYLILMKNFKAVLKNSELKAYLLIVLSSIAVITINILPLYRNAGEALLDSAFQVSTIITTTGFATADYTLWPSLSQGILIMLLLVGAMGGSTAGGMKVGRIVIMLKGIAQEIRKLLHPRAVQVIRLNGEAVSEDTFRGANTFLLTYLVCIAVSFLLISFDGFDFATNITAAITTMSNVGPGLGAINPMGNFGGFSSFSKVVLCLNMLLGRLEIFPMLVLFSPNTWRS